MKRSSSRIASILVLALAATIALGLVGIPAHAGTLRRVQMLRMMNGARSDHDVARLKLEDGLVHTARRHSEAMAAKGYIFHTASLASKLRKVTWRIAGENVGAGGTVEDLFNAFMASDGHRRNILRSSFKHVGIGMVKRDGFLWVTLMFYG